MPVRWNHFYGSSNYSYLLSFTEALGNGGANFVGATSSAATFASGPHKVILDGQLVIGLVGQPDSGLVETLLRFISATFWSPRARYQLGIDKVGPHWVRRDRALMTPERTCMHLAPKIDVESESSHIEDAALEPMFIARGTSKGMVL